MTIIQHLQIHAAQQAFAAWEMLGVHRRYEYLAPALASLEDEQAKMAVWQLDNAKQEISTTVVMPGPTGECNELSSHGRGPFLCTSSIENDTAKIGLVGQIFAALIAGNPVITVGETGKEIMDAITPFVAEGVIQNIAASAQDALVAADQLAGIAIVCDAQHAQTLNQQLAAKSGLICQLVAETDSVAFSSIMQPRYILRFVTERTVSTNTTAIGGNATLLKLGSTEDD